MSALEPWDLKDAGELVRNLFGRDQQTLFLESARSVNDRNAYSSFHYHEALRLTDDFERTHMSGLRTFLELHVAGAEEKELAFNRYMMEAGAHTIAAVQSLHAIPDIFAHVVYFGAGQNLLPGAPADHEINLPRVAECLAMDPAFAALASPVRSLQSGEGWRHLAAVSNMSKHRSLVRAAYSEDWTGTREKHRELQVSGFTRNGKPYPAVSICTLLQPEYDRLVHAVVSLGHELTNCLRSRVT